MENTARVIQFPCLKAAHQKVKSPVPTRRVKNIDGIKYFNRQQIRLLRRTVRDNAQLALAKGNTIAVKEWMLIDLLTGTGVRVSEASNLRCDDLRAGYGESAIFVRDGKGNRSRTIQIGEVLKKHLKTFIRWKHSNGEDTTGDSFVFLSQRGGTLSAQGIQQIVKKYLKQLGLYQKGKSVHALRHSYACELYRSERDLRAVQKQLGHSSIQSTQIYADVFEEDLQRQVSGLWGS